MRVIEKDLAEMRVAVHLPKWSHIDAPGVHIDAERGDPFVFAYRRVVPGEQETPLGVRAAARPHFLPASLPRLAPGDDTRRQPREVRARAPLGKQPAPEL